MRVIKPHHYDKIIKDITTLENLNFNLVIPSRLASRISPSGYQESLKTSGFSIAFEKCKEIVRM